MVLEPFGREVVKPEVEPPPPHAQQSAIDASSGLLATNLPLFSRLLQLPIPLGMDLLLTPGEHVLRGLGRGFFAFGKVSRVISTPSVDLLTHGKCGQSRPPALNNCIDQPVRNIEACAFRSIGEYLVQILFGIL
jgi:hypothetical protein